MTRYVELRQEHAELFQSDWFYPKAEPGEWAPSVYARFCLLNGLPIGDRRARSALYELPGKAYLHPRIQLRTDVFLALIDCRDDLAAWTNPKRLPRPAPLLSMYRFCLVCCLRELKDRGFSIWHANHQVPGIHRCYLCLGPLSETEVSPAAHLPHMAERRGTLHSGAGESHAEAIQEKYESLIYPLLDEFRTPVDYEVAIDLLEMQGRARVAMSGLPLDSARLWAYSKDYLMLFGHFSSDRVAQVFRRQRHDLRIYLGLLLGLTASAGEARSLLQESARARLKNVGVERA